MKRPFLSIVIPAFRAAGVLPRLLDSIFATKGFSDFEVIVVDDASPDETARVAEFYQLKVKVLRLKRNSGPARARNEGFLKDKDLTAITGVWVRPRKARGFFSNYKALRDWSYWINERDQKGYFYLFSTRIAAIKRDVFLRLGGFDQRYRRADIEDIEFTYRIASRYAVIFDEKIRVKHEFEGFAPVAKKYFRRSFYWSLLFSQRRKFSPVTMTLKETITGAAAVLSLPLAIGGIFWRPFWLAAVVCFLLTLWGNRKFLVYVFQEEGFVFALKSFLTSWLLYFVIYIGAGMALISLIIGRLFGKKAVYRYNQAVGNLV